MYVLRDMQLRDLPQVMTVNYECFPTPWSYEVFHMELTKNDHSYWVVLEVEEKTEAPRNFWKTFWRRMDHQDVQRQIIGFGGMWIVQGESHISNIGITATYRGLGLGELLLLSMLRRSQELGASWASLEVRVSNQSAINLYHKYGYKITRRRLAYYRDNNEDAHWMVVRTLNQDYCQLLEQHSLNLAQRLQWKDHFFRGGK